MQNAKQNHVSRPYTHRSLFLSSYLPKSVFHFVVLLLTRINSDAHLTVHVLFLLWLLVHFCWEPYLLYLYTFFLTLFLFSLSLSVSLTILLCFLPLLYLNFLQNEVHFLLYTLSHLICAAYDCCWIYQCAQHQRKLLSVCPLQHCIQNKMGSLFFYNFFFVE